MSSPQPGTVAEMAASIQFDDDATRHLAATANVDETFADELINEFLTEPRRAIPPSPGLDPVIVLHEAVSARRKRAIRDAALLALLILLIVGQWPYSLAWLLVAMAGGAAKTAISVGRAERKPGAGWLVITLTAIGIGLLTWYLSMTANADTPYYLSAEPSPWTTPSLLAGLAVLGVLLADKLRLHLMLRGRFSRAVWHQAPQHRPDSADYRQAWYAKRMRDIAASSSESNVHVHYGYNAFVGAGTLMQSWSMAIRLRPTDDQSKSTPLTPAMIYTAVEGKVMAMRTSDALAPGQRFGTLRCYKAVITSADALLRYRGDQLANAILPDLNRPPVNLVRPKLIDHMVSRSPEWIRPYLAFHVEGWHRELTVSTYLNAGCDDTTLYLDWQAYQLNPIKPEYRVEEMDLNHAASVLRDTFVEAFYLPFSVPRRIRTLWRTFRDANIGSMSADAFDSVKAYGAKRSIRELAADRSTRLHFQAVDGVRFMKLLQELTLGGVDKALRDCGLATSELVGQRNAVVNSTVINGSTFTGVTNVGQGNRSKFGTVNIGPLHISRHKSDSEEGDGQQ